MKKLILLLLLIPNLVMAASFDCAKASTKHEKIDSIAAFIIFGIPLLIFLYFIVISIFK